MISQFFIAVTGALAIWLVNDPRINRQRWAPIIGLAGQPFWFYETIQAGQWGMLALTVVFTAAWAKGFYYHWIKNFLTF